MLRILTLVVFAGLVAAGAIELDYIVSLNNELNDTHQQLTISMNEGYETRAELKAMTLEAHPFIVNGQVGPTASLELQCMQFKGLLPNEQNSPPPPETKAE